MVVANKVKFLKFPDYAFGLFIASVVLLPIGFGGNRPLPFGLAQVGLALGCMCLVLGRKNWQPPRLFPRLRVALALLAVVVAWAWLQAMPFVPGSWVHPLWKEARAVLGQNLHGTIAISPEDSLVGLGRLITYIAVGFLAYVLAQDPKRARQMVAALWASGVLICAYGLIEYICGGHRILWFEKSAYQTDLTATFVNRNHFAVYAGMVLTAGAALLVQSWREKVLGEKPHLRAAAMREWLAREGGVRIFSLMLVLLCIVLSHSRAGLVLSLAGLGSYFVFFQIYRKEFGRAIIVMLVAFIILTFVIMAARQYSDRFASLFTDYSSRDRFAVYQLALQALYDNPWLGYGLDGFQPVFRLYQRGMIMEFMHAHSDALESLLDLGLPAGFMLWTALGLLVSGLARGIARRRRYGMYPSLGLAACIIVIGHSMVDFSMQIPGVVFPWAMLLGAGLAQSWRRGEKEPAREWIE